MNLANFEWVQCQWGYLKGNAKHLGEQKCTIIIIWGIVFFFFFFFCFFFCLITPRWEACSHFIAVSQFICMSWYYARWGRVKLKRHIRVSHPDWVSFERWGKGKGWKRWEKSTIIKVGLEKSCHVLAIESNFWRKQHYGIYWPLLLRSPFSCFFLLK